MLDTIQSIELRFAHISPKTLWIFEETLSKRAAPPTVPATMIARITSICRSVSAIQTQQSILWIHYVRIYQGANQSALGQKQTCWLLIAMPALPPTADMRGRDQDVCFGPLADIPASPIDVRFTP
jgi:hypothetical protein